MASSAHAISHALDREICGWQPEKEEMNGIAGGLEIMEPRRKAAAGESGLECEVDSLMCEVAQARQHNSASRDRCGVGIER